jgi:hypothetical protein
MELRCTTAKKRIEANDLRYPGVTFKTGSLPPTLVCNTEIILTPETKVRDIEEQIQDFAKRVEKLAKAVEVVRSPK